MKRLTWLMFAGCVWLAAACVAPPAAQPAATTAPRLPTATPLPTAIVEPATAIPEPTPTIQAFEGPTEIVKAVLDFTAQTFGADVARIEVVNVEEVDWPDSCLGVNKTDEMCLQVITPGYRIIMMLDGRQIEVHTNAGARSIRLASP